MKTSNQPIDLPNGHLYDIASDELNEALWSDQQFIKVLNSISKGAQGFDLRTECKDHAIQIDTQMERLREVFKITGIKMNPKESKAMAALLDEAVEAIEQFQGQEALDTVLTCAAQKICCMRMAIYSNVITLVGLMEFEAAELILANTCQEENMAEDRLQSIAYEKLIPLEEIPERKKGVLASVREFFTG